MTMRARFEAGGATSRRSARLILRAALALTAALCAFAPAAASASPTLLSKFCPTGAAGGQCRNPRGIAVDPASGDYYVSDLGNRRIEKFSAWGQFLRAWGWDVVASGPDDTATGQFEICVPASGDLCKAGVEATGAFGPGPKGSAGAGQLAGPVGIALDSSGDVYVADRQGSGNVLPSNRVQKFDPEGHFLLMFGGDVIADGAEGTGAATPGSTAVTGVATTAKAFRIGQPLEGAGIEAGTTIAALGPGTITLSQPASPAATGSPTAISSPAGASNVSANEVQTVRLGANTTGGSFALTFNTPNPSPSSATATAIPFNATALQLEEKLEALSNIGAGNVAVSGPAGGPWAVEFKGVRYADTYVEPIGANASGLAVSSGAKQATVTHVKGGEICSVASECQAASEGTAGGEFAYWQAGSFIAPSPDGQTIYVGDEGRVQEFDTAGHYLGDFPDAAGLLAENSVKALAVDPASGDLYVAFGSESVNIDANPDVYRLAATSGAQVCQTAPGQAKVPTAIATSADGKVYVANGRIDESPPPSLRELLRFGPDCGGREVLFDEAAMEAQGFTGGAFNPTASGGANPTGLAVSTACGIEGADILLASPTETNSFLALYGPSPDPELCPPPAVPPSIEDQYATSVGAEGATVKAKINPHFWNDTRYYVQYGTGVCSEGGCESSQPLPPGLLLSEGVSDSVLSTAAVSLAGLAPDTGYHYRFVAESGGGGPLYGVGATAAEPQGEESSFTTSPTAAPSKEDCPNQAFRGGFSALLPECRAYEMVSPLDKNNGDIATDEAFGPQPGPGSLAGNFELASSDGDRTTYSSFTAFGSPQGLPLFGQYLSSRDPASGWSTHSISPPRDSVPFYGPTSSADVSQFKAFGEDLCQGWFIQDSDYALSSAQPPGVANIYRREDGSCGEAGYGLLTPVAPVGFPDAKELVKEKDVTYFPTLQGVSADSGIAVLRINAVMSEDACRVTIEKEGEEGPEVTVDEGRGIYQVYLHAEGEDEMHLVSLLPSGAPACVHSSTGTAQGLQGGFREDNVHHALSEDGSRVFWSTSASPNNLNAGGGAAGDQAGSLYVRLNPARSSSATQFGGATGTGDLTGPALATGSTTKGSKTISGVQASKPFAVGQPISSPTPGVIPAGATVTVSEPGKLKISLAASKGANEVGPVELSGPASEIISGVSTATGAFAVGQRISGSGIAAGTTISSVGAGTITLSAKATGSAAGAPLEAWSECTEAEKACTLEITSSSNARFWGADPQGTRAIYTADGGLYEYDVAAQESTAIAPSGVLGAMGMSEDANRVYFASTAALSGEQENSEGAKAQAGKPNLYLHERGAGATFIGTLASEDTHNGATIASPASPIATLPDLRVARVSADGEHAAFLSAAPLTGYVNADAASGQPDGEVFFYDADTGGGAGQLRCISCDPSGARPTGRDIDPGGLPYWAAAQIPGWQSELYSDRALSDDGDRLFFESFEGLVPRDTNERRDVYEWRRASGKSECIEGFGFELYVPAAGGCIGLISSGKDTVNAEFLDASASGSDVFFITGASLLPQDRGLLDVYDARIGGGFPPPAPTPPSCEGEACQGIAQTPASPTPASSAYQGPGNLAQPPSRKRTRCGKGDRRVVRKGRARCVKRHHRSRRHAHRRTAR